MAAMIRAHSICADAHISRAEGAANGGKLGPARLRNRHRQAIRSRRVALEGAAGRTHPAPARGS